MTAKGFSEIDYSNRDQLAMEFPAHLIYAGELAQRAGERIIFGRFDLSIPGYSVLVCLDQCLEPLSMTELKDAILLLRSPSNLTQLVDDLERRMLVRRLPSPLDRRVSLVELTGAGRELLVQVNDHYLQTMRDYLGAYSLTELQATMKIITRFIEDSLAALGIDKTKITDI